MRVLGLKDLDTARMERGAVRLGGLAEDKFMREYTVMTNQLRKDQLRASAQITDCLDWQVDAGRSRAPPPKTRCRVQRTDGSMRPCRSRSELIAQRAKNDRQFADSRFKRPSTSGVFG